MAEFINKGFRIEPHQIPVGAEYNVLIELLETVLEENMAIRDELANLNCPHPLMTKQDVADYFQVSIRTVENMVRDGELKPVMIKSLVRFKRKEVERCAQRASVVFFQPE